MSDIKMHHITVNHIPLCKTAHLNRKGVSCSYWGQQPAKSAVLRLIEQNLMQPVKDYGVVPGKCDCWGQGRVASTE